MTAQASPHLCRHAFVRGRCRRCGRDIASVRPEPSPRETPIEAERRHRDDLHDAHTALAEMLIVLLVLYRPARAEMDAMTRALDRSVEAIVLAVARADAGDPSGALDSLRTFIDTCARVPESRILSTEPANRGSLGDQNEGPATLESSTGPAAQRRR